MSSETPEAKTGEQDRPEQSKITFRFCQEWYVFQPFVLTRRRMESS